MIGQLSDLVDPATGGHHGTFDRYERHGVAWNGDDAGCNVLGAYVGMADIERSAIGP